MSKNYNDQMDESDGSEEVDGDDDQPCGRGRRMQRLPTHSVWTESNPKQMKEIARWAIRSVRLPQSLVDEAEQVIMFAFARHRVPKGIDLSNGSLMRTTAKRWAIDVKRKMGYPVKLSSDAFFSQEAREKARTSDSELDPSILLYGEGDDDDQLHWEFDAAPNDDAEYGNLDEIKVRAIDEIWFDLKPTEQGILRHVIAGRSFARAGELERISLGTAKAHHNKIEKKINKKLAELMAAEGA